MPDTEHLQKDLMIVEALLYLSHDLKEIDPQRSKQALRLAEEIAAHHGLDLKDVVLQIDYGSASSCSSSSAIRRS